MPKVVNPEVLTTNNRFKQDQDNDSVPDYLYDAAGNTTKDANNKKFTYDGENKQTKVETVDSYGNVNATLGTYFYDGDGKRVKKVSATETVIFIYDASGKLVAEYANQIATTTAQVSYLTSDHLGSPRINTDQNGKVISRHDYQPFGEEIYSIPGNMAREGYSTDEVRKQFTSYERDNESDLDFAQARYYNKNHGRFTSVDPLMASATVFDPQSFNRFIYVKNNPLNFIDPLGLSGCDPQTDPNCDENVAERTFSVDVKIDDEGVVNTTVGGTQVLPVKIKGRSFWGWLKHTLGFDTGTGTPTAPAPPTMPLPTDPGPGPLEPSPPSGSSPDAPSSGSPDSTGGDSSTAVTAIFLALLQKKLNALLNGEEYNGIVYRGGAFTDTNLAPRIVDTDGLSTFTKVELAAKPGEKYQTIDTSKLSDGLVAIRKGKHVSITPRKLSSLLSWMSSRGNSHPLTEAVKRATIAQDQKRPK